MDYRGSYFDTEEFKKKGGKIIPYRCFKTLYLSGALIKCVGNLKRKATDARDVLTLQRFFTNTIYRVDDIYDLQRIFFRYGISSKGLSDVFTKDLSDILSHNKRGIIYTFECLDDDEVVIVRMYMPMRSKKVHDGDELIAVGRLYGRDTFWGTIALQ